MRLRSYRLEDPATILVVRGPAHVHKRILLPAEFVAAELGSFIQAALAKHLPDDQVPADLVRMGTTLSFRTSTGQQRRVTLVFPQDADIAQGKVSVLTPVGAALIGLSVGQSTDWTARDGRVHRLTVESVEEAMSSPEHQDSAEALPG